MSPDWWRDCRDGIEKCSSPTGDGNHFIPSLSPGSASIEKCSSPTGDGNPLTSCHAVGFKALRNVVPRQGTETGVQRRMEL